MSDILALIKLFVAEFGLYQVSKLYNILFQQLKERVPITLSRFFYHTGQQLVENQFQAINQRIKSLTEELKRYWFL